MIINLQCGFERFRRVVTMIVAVGLSSRGAGLVALRRNAVSFALERLVGASTLIAKRTRRIVELKTTLKEAARTLRSHFRTPVEFNPQV